MVKVNNVFFCPDCEFEVEVGAKECPHCGKEFSTYSGTFFIPPPYICKQLESHEQRLHLNTDKGQRDNEKVELQDVYKDFDLYLKECSNQDRIAALQDSYLVLQSLMHSRANIETFKRVTALGKKIGKLSEALEQYFSAGGMPNAGIKTTSTLLPNHRDDSWCETSATGCGDKS